MRTSKFAIFSLLFALLLAVTTVRAQNLTASMTGVVTDTSGAVVPGTHVTLKNVSTGVSYEAVTNQQGSYTIAEAKPGPGYTATYTHDGFQTLSVTGIYLNVATTRTQNAQLKVGSVVQTVAVSAANQTVTLDTTDATVGNNFQVSFLNDLPIQIRDSPAALFTQQPGVTPGGAVTGGREDQDNVTLDGLDVNDNETGNFGAIVANAPVDSVQEFRGTTAGELASAGEGGGGQYELVTRSGTNHFHGALVEYHRDTDFEANNWFNNDYGTPRPPLVRNQFGGNVGGPVLKDKLFFFFDYNGRRDTLANLVERTVPIGAFRNGIITYRNTSGGNSTLSSAQVAALDPLNQGFNAPLLALINKRYPQPNDLSGNYGDLLNTAGFRFNAPYPLTENDYVARLDYTLNSSMKIWAVGHVARENATQSAIQFPGDPETYPFLDKSSSWAIAHNWSIGANMLNQAEYGETYEDYAFPNTYNPEGINQFETVGGNGTGGAIIDPPYARAINAQSRTFPIPEVRDDFSWLKGKHSLTMGGSFKWESPNNNTILDYNTPTLGLGGHMPNLNTPPGVASLRPNDLASGNYVSLYDSAFALALAPYTSVGATYNYNAQGSAVPQGTGAIRDYRYYETELYVGDTWKVTPSLTLTYGLRWQNYTVPYERHGLESVDQMGTPGGQLFPVEDTTFNNYFGARVAQSNAGIEGNLAVPLFDYVLGGKANHAPSLYHTDNRDFAPRFSFAYSPGWDKKTVFNGGAGIIYDHTVVNAVLYQQTQFSYIFESVVNDPMGVPDNARASLQSLQRFNSFSTAPAPPAAPVITTPYYPFVSGSGTSAIPYGLANGGAFNEMIDPSFRTPYSIQFNLGWQHQFPQGYLLRTTWAGRLGRRLLAQADTEQLVDFPDKTSGQWMSQAFANMEKQLRSGAPLTAQPWFEDILPAGLGQSYGFANNTELVGYGFQPYTGRGDFADTVEALSAYNFIPPNVGMASQLSENTMYTNKGFSTYNGLLVTLHKNAGYGLQFDLNYTWSHSIDNVSVIANEVAYGGYGFICDVLHPRECRGNSDFDITNLINGNFIYELPVGRGRALAGNAPRWLDEAVGNWEVSGLPSWHTGTPYFASANAFVAGYANDAPAILTGPISLLKANVHKEPSGTVYAFDNPTAANAAYTGPVGLTIGSRNNLRGPGYFDMDMGLGKTFPVWENWNLKFRGDAFNAFNHPSFNNPVSDITDVAGIFGTISSTSSTARVLQVSLRLEF